MKKTGSNLQPNPGDSGKNEDAFPITKTNNSTGYMSDGEDYDYRKINEHRGSATSFGPGDVSGAGENYMNYANPYAGETTKKKSGKHQFPGEYKGRTRSGSEEYD